MQDNLVTLIMSSSCKIQFELIYRKIPTVLTEYGWIWLETKFFRGLMQFSFVFIQFFWKLIKRVEDLSSYCKELF